MRAFTTLYPALLRIAFLAQIQYRASNVIWLIGMLLEPLVFLVVWTRVAEAQGGQVAGYGTREFAAYYISLLAVNHFTFSWIMHTFQYRIQYGQLSFELLRPVHPIHNDLSDNLAYKVLMAVVVAPTIALMVLGFDPLFSWRAEALVAFAPALLLAFAVRFLMEWSLALAAFWTTRVLAMNQIYFAVMMFLSGRIAPLAMFPDWMQDLAMALPFYYTMAFPVELFLGRLSSSEALQGIGIQLAWLLAAATLITLVWRRAVRRFTAVGA